MKQEAGRIKSAVSKYAFRILLVSSFFIFPIASISHAANDSRTNPDINSGSFSLFSSQICDGPPGAPYTHTPCDFNAMMALAQRLINVMLVVGVLAAIVGFCYAGFLLIAHGSEPGKRSEASEIFKKVFIGFIIMLTAWFIVFQILSWLTGSSGFGVLLGRPSGK